MKRYKKTYAIFNLAEKHTAFMLGKLKVSVSFTGGIVTKKGVTPATFTTGDPVVQLAIEQSTDYKKGVIKLSAQYAMEGEVKVGRNKAEAPEAPATPAPESFIQARATAVPAETGEAEEKKEDVPEESGLEVVEASCKDVAKAYLQDHFGENPAPLRTRDDVQAAAAKYGIEFRFD